MGQVRKTLIYLLTPIFFYLNQSYSNKALKINTFIIWVPLHHVCQVKLHLNYFQITNQYSPFTKHQTFHYNVFHSFLLITFSCLILSYFIQGTVKCCISKSKSRNNGSSLSISPSYFNFIKPSPSSFFIICLWPLLPPSASIPRHYRHSL